MKSLCLSIVLLLSVSCIKTAEQMNREKRMDDQLNDSRGLVTDLMSQMKDMQSQLDKMNGRMEEMEHKNKKLDPEAMTQMNESMALMKSQQESQSAQLTQIQAELKEQRTFIEKVTASLSSDHGEKASAHKSQKKSAKSELAHGLELIKQNSYADARTELEALIDHDELSPGDKNKVLHGLGKVEYYTKNFDKSLVYFSKIYTKYPKASLAPSCLLFIGRNLGKLGKKDAAKEAFEKVTEDYPGSAEAKEAKKEI